ncbi:Transcriptional regulator, AcrR family (plasmid) [Cupriavidus sp. U2]|uniref:TetR/AcrR family transcriptional regulator n=1 Tax=Cupriavidus sp. U2 TaxID=2920269 RepID=UPI00129DB11B|nr:TetR/AcrR family transcriptional regulator [Cupriavidus sp. U2]KAI3593391.1 Transcriptional regulator, AcrR family [Cupriavidus sp. U2]
MSNTPIVDTNRTESTVSVRKPCRPRGDAARVAILEAAYAQMEEFGLAGFTIEGVAARAGAAKTTIYRWWPSRESLAVAAFLAAALPKINFTSTGSASDAIQTQIRKLVAVYEGKTGRVVRDLIAAGNSDPAAATAFVEGYVRPRRIAAREVLQRGIDSGEFKPDLDMEAAIDALYGPVFYRLLVGHGPLDVTWITNVASLVLAGCKSNSSAVLL